jgi:hypothetical protein
MTNSSTQEKPSAPSTSGTAPATAPAPAAATSGFLERNLGTVLTFLGVAATAGVAFFGGIFKENQAPSARITLALGNSRITIEEGTSAPAALPVVPVHQTLRLSGSNSRDPDGTIDLLQFRWTLIDLFPASGALTSPAPITGAAGRTLEWKPDHEGLFEAVLDVTDDHECNWLQRILAGGGCRKTSTAVIHFAVREATPPLVRLPTAPVSGLLPYSTPIDASQSKAFDNEPLTFFWTINDVYISNHSSFTFGVGQPNDTFAAAGNYVLRGKVQDSWGQTTSIERHFRLDSPLVSTSVVQPPDAAAAPRDQAGPLQPLPRVLVLTGERVIGDASQSLQLPSRIVTNGYPLTIRARELTADEAQIVGFEAVETASAASGSAGVAGAAGSGEGASGVSGTKGQEGAPGSIGKSAGPIQIIAATFSGNLNILNSGTAGLRGGNGGRGGGGGPGASGSSASSSIFDCKRGPGRGGDGGNGGAGGNAGSGGNGGSGGPIVITLGSITPTAHIRAAAAGAPGGDPGQPGLGGEGGSGGSEGPISGLCGGAGRSGQRGYAGPSGAPAAAGQSGNTGNIVLQIGTQRFERSASLEFPAPGGR